MTGVSVMLTEFQENNFYNGFWLLSVGIVERFQDGCNVSRLDHDGK
jgi:hypothetical protein